MAKKLIRFDWAMKRLLRNKANFDILEGFLSELLHDEIIIKQILESETNKSVETDKFNRVDILVENAKGELIIIEIQNSKEFDYFQRMLYGVSKIIIDQMNAGQPYSAVKKVIAITIAYFDLGQCEDYVYHGSTTFTGYHKNDPLYLSAKQVELYKKIAVQDLYPEYWIIKVGKFENKVIDKLDEWIYFFKNAEIRSTFSAKGIKEANKKLDELQLSEKDRQAYNAYLKELHDIASENYTKAIDFQDAVKKAILEGMESGRKGIAETALRKGLDIIFVAELTGLPVAEVETLKLNIKNNLFCYYFFSSSNASQYSTALRVCGIQIDPPTRFATANTSNTSSLLTPSS